MVCAIGNFFWINQLVTIFFFDFMVNMCISCMHFLLCVV